MNFIVYVIVACEIGFWVLLAGGLAVRYLLGAKRLGLVLLACVPVLDVVLLAAATADLARGGTAESAHGLAALYLGFSVAFGHSLIRWGDIRFAHRFAGGPAPEKPVKGSAAYRRGLWIEYARVLLAAAIASAVLLALIFFVAADTEAEVLWGWIRTTGLVVGIWLIAGPVWGMFERPAQTAAPVQAAAPAKTGAGPLRR